MKFYSFLILGFLIISNVGAQDDEYVYPELRNYDFTYQDNIKSIQFHLADSKTEYPIISLQSPSHLVFSFDDLDADNKDYSYKVIHCNADWTPSEDIDPMEYIDGYQENRFYEQQNSFSTVTEYTHYEITFPNEDLKFTKSGNYLLKIYLDEDEDALIITRRFMVFDTKMKVVPNMRRSAAPPNAATHQELHFSVQHAGIQVGNPREEVKVAVLQNGRWDNAFTSEDLEATFIDDEKIVFDKQGQLAFPGYKEFRPLDLRSFIFRTQQVQNMERIENQFHLKLFNDFSREHSAYLFTHDLNGKFYIQTHDNNDWKLQGEYGHVYFSLEMPKRSDKVYLFGNFSDWQVRKEFEMTYNEKRKTYEYKGLFKNGFYDYQYVVAEDQYTQPNGIPTEGSTFEAENDYLFLVYYRAFGSLYDELVAIQKFNSRPE
ncbi:MAG: DUF5103 domain-containing protein [Aureispira sp.]|nr:DUF5103 domain-containing protein [Aureispira sp.]